MRCSVRIPIGNSGRCETYCYEPLNDKGECPVHGPQWVKLTDTCPTCLGTGKVSRDRNQVPDLQPAVTQSQQNK